MGAYWASASNAGGLVTEICSGRLLAYQAYGAGTRLLSFSGQKRTICKGFMKWDCSGCAGATALSEYICEGFEHVARHKGFKAFWF